MSTLWQVAEDWPLFQDLFDNSFCINDVNYMEFNPKPGDAVVLWGGPDINPALYYDAPLSTTQINVERDTLDLRILTKASDNCIPVFGVCRGMQFLAVFAGGTLIQHLDEHDSINHEIYIDLSKNPDWYQSTIIVNSSHHQAVRAFHGEIEIIAACDPPRSKQHLVGPHVYPALVVSKEAEALFVPHLKMFGVQFHPEYSDAPEDSVKYAKYLFKQMM